MSPASASRPMPAAFLGHGSPMNALERNRYSAAWRAFGAAVPRPRAILAVSAHWHVDALAVTAMPHPRTIHDFYGFPQALYDVQYPAPGLPALAEEVADAVAPDFVVGADRDGWGLDHGTWSVLVHAFPAADIPVVQLSLDARRPLDWHLALGAKLAPLRQRGVLVVGSGNLVHNLRALDWAQPEGGFDWARRFDADARAVLAERPHDLPALATHPDYRKAVPTDEHFLPLLYLAGLSAATGRASDVLVDGFAYGALSMVAFTLDADCPRIATESEAAAAALPRGVAPEATNA